jgi:hypothetical protein
MTGQVNFNSHSDAVVAVAAQLVNELTDGERHGRPYAPPQGEDRDAAIIEILRRGNRPPFDVTPAEGDELAGLAGRLRVVFDAVSAGDIDTAALQVNRLLEETSAQPRLERHDSQPWHVHFHGTSGTLAGDWAAAGATGLAIVLGSDSYDRLGVCTAPHCDRVYVDVSRNGTRRFCSTACQNRVKAAAFRARRDPAGL